jgi:hypothetical protein
MTTGVRSGIHWIGIIVGFETTVECCIVTIQEWRQMKANQEEQRSGQDERPYRKDGQSEKVRNRDGG